eukprot:Skav209438  [mRNA]  locus=scaffold805:196201:196767:- [translate_table: standard]
MSEHLLHGLVLSVRALATAVDRLATILENRLTPQSVSLPATGELDSEPLEAGRGSPHFRHIDWPGESSEEEEVPEALVRYCERRFTITEPTPRARAESAYWAGYRARHCIRREVRYEPRERLPGLRHTHWVVLRSSTSDPFRVTTLSVVSNYVRAGDILLIQEGFNSWTEVEMFLQGAQRQEPPLREC